MNIPLTIIIGTVLSYLLGSIPFGLLIAKTKGIDIRKEGSGNIGATNVFRCVGKSWGILTFILDVLKGFTAAFLIAGLIAKGLSPEQITGIRLLCGFMAIAGHNWPIFIKFKGGKGVATTVGAILGITPTLVLIGFIIWLIIFLTSRYVSLASILTAIALAAYVWIAKNYYGTIIPVIFTILALLIIWRHKSNIKRLLNGTENRFDFNKKKKGGK